jgi:hypothetical protein
MAVALRIFLTILIVLAFGRAAWADGGSGHDHGAETTATTLSPRVEARLGDQQMVLIYSNRKAFEDTSSRFLGGDEPAKLNDPRIAVFLEGFADAVPTRGAKLEAVINFLPEELSEAAPGVYLSGPVVLAGGSNEIEINYTIGEQSGTLTLLLLVPGGATSGTGGLAIEGPADAVPSWFFVLAALVIYATVLWLFLGRRRHSLVR